MGVPDVTGLWHFIPCVLLKETLFISLKVKHEFNASGVLSLSPCDITWTTSGGTCPSFSLPSPPSVPSFEAQQGSGESSTVSACGKWTLLNFADVSVIILVGNRPQNGLPVSTYAATT